MSERFSVAPAHVAGYAELASNTASDCWDIARFVRDNAKSDDHFGTVMKLLRTPVDEFADATDARIGDRAWTLNAASSSLVDTAVDYRRNDSGGRFRDDPDGLAEFPGAVEYPRETGVTSLLREPGRPAHADVRTLAEQCGGDLQLAEDIVWWVSGMLGRPWSLLGALIDPLTGNWNAIRQKGEVLVIAGEACEAAAANLTSSLTTLEAHWDGVAAHTFNGYLRRLATAIEREGAFARVASALYGTVAWVIEWAARYVVGAIDLAVAHLRKWTPGTGWGSVAIDLGESLFDGTSPIEEMRADWTVAKNFFDDAEKIIEVVTELPAQVETILSTIR
jgi:hypothetical protein